MSRTWSPTGFIGVGAILFPLVFITLYVPTWLSGDPHEAWQQSRVVGLCALVCWLLAACLFAHCAFRGYGRAVVAAASSALAVFVIWTVYLQFTYSPALVAFVRGEPIPMKAEQPPPGIVEVNGRAVVPLTEEPPSLRADVADLLSLVQQAMDVGDHESPQAAVGRGLAAALLLAMVFGLPTYLSLPYVQIVIQECTSSSQVVRVIAYSSCAAVVVFAIIVLFKPDSVSAFHLVMATGGLALVLLPVCVLVSSARGKDTAVVTFYLWGLASLVFFTVVAATLFSQDSAPRIPITSLLLIASVIIALLTFCNRRRLPRRFHAIGVMLPLISVTVITASMVIGILWPIVTNPLNYQDGVEVNQPGQLDMGADHGSDE